MWSGLFIPDPDADFLPIPDPRSRGQKGTGSLIRIRNIAFWCAASCFRPLKKPRSGSVTGFICWHSLTTHILCCWRHSDQCCGSASPWCGSGFDLSSWCGSCGSRCGSWFWMFIWCGSGFLFDADLDADTDLDPVFYFIWGSESGFFFDPDPGGSR